MSKHYQLGLLQNDCSTSKVLPPVIVATEAPESYNNIIIEDERAASFWQESGWNIWTV